jgi:ATP-dependent DNA helicase RecQ
LYGRKTSEIRARNHDELETFGTCDDEDDTILNAVINQAELSGYIEKSVEDYGVLKLTPAGEKLMEKPTEFMITKDNEFTDDIPDTDLQEGGTSAVDTVLYQMLSDLRKDISVKKKIPPYVIFQDQSLEAMATIYPITEQDLQNIPGVGAGKAHRYGKEFCELIKKWCEDNNIERPEDMRVRMVAKKSKVKVAIIQAIDRQVDLNDIALAQGLDFSELLDEMESIVYSGTRINIDYFLEENMDDDRIDEIYDYFKTSETDSIDDALDNLDDDFSEEEVRLVRIKFLSEMGN